MQRLKEFLGMVLECKYIYYGGRVCIYIVYVMWYGVIGEENGEQYSVVQVMRLVSMKMCIDFARIGTLIFSSQGEIGDSSTPFP